MANIAFPIFGIVSLLFAGVAGWFGWKQHRKRRLVSATPTSEIGAITDEGTVEITGEVSCDDPFDSPIQGDEAVVSAWEIEDWDETGQSGMWQTKASGLYTTPFTLHDGTGQVQVAIGDHLADESGTGISDMQLGPLDFDQFLTDGVSIDNVAISLERFAAVTTVPPDADPPERIAEFLEGETTVAEQSDSITNILDVGHAHGERRFYEGTIAPGDEVYLLGEATATDGATHPLSPDDVEIQPPDEDGLLLVSDQSEEELLADLGTYKLAYAVAAGFALLGIALLLVGTGVVPLG